jgi:hypothetical protein
LQASSSRWCRLWHQADASYARLDSDTATTLALHLPLMSSILDVQLYLTLGTVYMASPSNRVAVGTARLGSRLTSVSNSNPLVHLLHRLLVCIHRHKKQHEATEAALGHNRMSVHSGCALLCTLIDYIDQPARMSTGPDCPLKLHT